MFSNGNHTGIMELMATAFMLETMWECGFDKAVQMWGIAINGKGDWTFRGESLLTEPRGVRRRILLQGSPAPRGRLLKTAR